MLIKPEALHPSVVFVMKKEKPFTILPQTAHAFAFLVSIISRMILVLLATSGPSDKSLISPTSPAFQLPWGEASIR